MTQAIKNTFENFMDKLGRKAAIGIFVQLLATGAAAVAAYLQQDKAVEILDKYFTFTNINAGSFFIGNSAEHFTKKGSAPEVITAKVGGA